MERKIDASLKKHIETIARFLPELEVSKSSVFQKVRGEQLIERMLLNNEVPNDKDGNPINPKKNYFIALGNAKADHIKEITKAFKHGGFDEVNKYVAAVKDKAAAQASEKAKSKTHEQPEENPEASDSN